MPAPKGKVGSPTPVVKRAAQSTEAPSPSGSQKSRFWLMYPPKLITDPVIWQLAKKFPVITNVRQASVNDEIGIVCLELEGQRPDIKAAVQWLEKTGIKVEPVEINVIES